MPINLDNVTNIMLGNTPVEQVSDSQGNVLWSAAPVVLPNYFYMEDISGNTNTVSIKKNNTNAPTIEVFASTDTVNWSSIGSTSTTAITATIPANGRLYLKATATTWAYEWDKYNTLSVNGNFNIGGNIMSLLYSDDFENKVVLPTGTNYTFYSLFYSNTTLVSASNLNLAATTLSGNRCYEMMFRGCTHLTRIPALPATTLASRCYCGMFFDCTALTTTPALPATTLVSDCYNAMFQGCTALTTAPALPATTLANYCYNAMFQGCTALTTAPALPATTLARECYQNMFNGCTNLNSVTIYANDISATNCLSNWLDGVSQTGDFYNLGGATYPSGASGIPSGWIEHTSL